MSQYEQVDRSGRRVLVALGGNLASPAGDPAQTIVAALADIQKEFGVVPQSSRIYATPAFPAGSGPDYANAAATFRSALAPVDILSRLHRIEAGFARQRQQRWGARTLDIDLIAVDDLVAPDADTQTMWRNLPLPAQKTRTPDRLILPHPRMQDRAFVLVPLAEVAPDWVHPLTGQSVAQMRDALSDAAREEVKPLT